MTSPFSGARSSSYYVKEVTPGVTPATPEWTTIFNTGGLPAIIKDALISDVLDDSREITGIRVGNEQAQGEFSVELSQSNQDELIANAMGSTWVAGISQAALDMTVDDAAKTFTRAAGSFVSDGVTVGDLIRFDDLTGNNAVPFIVTTVTALVVTGAGITVELTAENVTSDYTTGDKIGTGSVCSTVSVLTWLRGNCGTTDKYLLTKGVEFTGFNFEVAVNAQVTGSFPLLGRTQVLLSSPPAGSTFTNNVVTRSFAGVDGKVLVDGALKALVTSTTITNDNEASAQFELGDKGVAFVERGRATNTISMSAFMDDTDLIQSFIDETETAFYIILNGPEGSMSFSMPKAFLTAATPELSGPTSITQTLDGTGTGTSLQSSLYVQRLPAP